MTPFINAQMDSLKQGLLLMEAVVTFPIGLTYDLKAARETLFPLTEEEEDQRRRNRPKLPLPQALDALTLTRQSLTILSSIGSLERAWIDRTQKVLSRVEFNLGGELRRQRAASVRGLYVIVDPQNSKGRSPLEFASAALDGGAKIIQLRDKTTDTGDLITTAQKMLTLCQQQGALFIANDRVDLALACGAHGIHLGQHDLPISNARSILSQEQIIGRSNAVVEEAVQSQNQGADYVAVGTIFPTGSKDNTRPAGLDTLRRVKESVSIPVVAIGGINESNAREVIAAGADAIAVISAVGLANNPEEASRRLSSLIEEALAKRSM